MTAQIINLHQFRSTIRCRVNGVAFPQVYRISGVYFDTGENGALVPGQKTALPCYSLSPDETGGLAATTVEAIRGFTPGVDDGWLFVRHHMDRVAIEGYLDAIMDFDREDNSRAARAIYRTEHGLFSLIHRPPAVGCQDNLVVYITKVPEVTPSGFGTGWRDHFQIVLPDGSISEDSELLVPPDEE